LGVFLYGEGIDSPDLRGERVVDDSFCVLFNAHYEPIQFVLPKKEWGESWTVVLDTNQALAENHEPVYKAGAEVTVESRSLQVLRCVRDAAQS